VHAGALGSPESTEERVASEFFRSRRIPIHVPALPLAAQANSLIEKEKIERIERPTSNVEVKSAQLGVTEC
jgi:uncharacterized protein YggU (UPF0235/DUF167 family)